MTQQTAYEVTIGQRTVRVLLTREGDALRARVDDGADQPVSLRTVHGVLRSMVVGHRRAEVLATRSPDGSGASIAIAGLEYQAEVVDAARARLASVAGGRSAGHARKELKAPMPGLVVKLLCQPGDTVEPGQPLVVLQAMKMENELSLSRGGNVASVSATAGQTVEQGQVLVVVE